MASYHHSATLGPSTPARSFLVERNRMWLVVKLFPTRLLVQVPYSNSARRLVLHG
jgi:hypothetical protein